MTFAAMPEIDSWKRAKISALHHFLERCLSEVEQVYHPKVSCKRIVTRKVCVRRKTEWLGGYVGDQTWFTTLVRRSESIDYRCRVSDGSTPWGRCHIVCVHTMHTEWGGKDHITPQLQQSYTNQPQRGYTTTTRQALLLPKIIHRRFSLL